MPRHRSLVAVLVLLVLAGCGGSNADRAGGSSDTKPLVLTFLGNEPLPSYADAVRRLSRGSLRIRFAPPAPWRPADYEARVIDDVRAGRADGAWVGSRAWDGVGVRSFDALVAPLLIDSYELEGAVLMSPLASAMLADLRPLGLTGLGVLPGPIRRLAGSRPLRAPADLAGLRIGTQYSRVGEETLAALGARPVPMAPNRYVSGLDGVEQRSQSASTGRRAP